MRGAACRLFTRPRDVIQCDEAAKVEQAFERMEAGLASGLHVAGVLAYELGYVLEPRLQPLLPERRSFPLLLAGLFDAPLHPTAEALDIAFADLPPPPPITEPAPAHEWDAHAAKVGKVLELIAAGDLYQANLTFPIRFRYSGDPVRLYAALRCSQPTAFSALVALNGRWVLSVSPELFFSTDGSAIECRPMKGTAARASDVAADASVVERLMADPKQRAENLMITDLIRNDLARICEAGSVRVPDLFTPETHPSFHALTSTVMGRLRKETALRERMAAVFPCGSIVGAPKIRAAEVLREMEVGPRGAYTGAIGAFAPDGSAIFNVAIQTAVLNPDGEGEYGVGGGVVADSDPRGEYAEARLKGRVLEGLAEDFELIETLRWSPTRGYVRLARHLDRLAASAAVLGFAFVQSAVLGEMQASAGRWLDAGLSDRRVRLRLQRSGASTIESGTAPPLTTNAAVAGIAAHAVLDAADPYLRHKTSRRDVYDLASSEATSAGWDEALILNRRGEIADLARSTVFAQDEGGGLLTPAIESGALPGVLRAELIETGRAREARLSPADIAGSPQILLGNSLRGLQRARLAG